MRYVVFYLTGVFVVHYMRVGLQLVFMFVREAYSQLASWLNLTSLSLGISLDASKLNLILHCTSFSGM